MNEIKQIEAAQMKPVLDEFHVGDTVKVHFKIVEGANERIQIYEGLVIAIKNSRVGRTFTVRKNSYGVGVERIFPVHSPRIAKVEVARPGRVRRSKLYYIREKIGKAAKIRELLGPKAARARAKDAAVVPADANAPTAAAVTSVPIEAPAVSAGEGA
ncbi:MAG: 50S ribosomal protein L19 [Spirochaetaceae bacterium]|jgi:large subunit ribosomal protein L19|nr:50S ribosomal protein L19 [Spirochaetaceae bacterium]